MYNIQNAKKVCSFCVSDLHLITMLLPYLDKKTKEDEKFITILEKELTEQVKLVLSRLTLNDADKNNLLNINWKSRKIQSNKNLEKQILKSSRESSKINIIINGSKQYIEQVNKNIIEISEKNQISNVVRIINCFDITTLDEDIKSILKTHDTILNTSGEKDISEVFEGFEKQKGA